MYHNYPITAVNMKNVDLNDDFWLPKIRMIQSTTIRFAFDKCREEGRMENFLIAGGKVEGKVCGTMPFDDTDLYKIIEGASYSLVSNPDTDLDAYLDSIIEIIKTGQEPDGYITTWFTIDSRNPPAPWVKPSDSRWENEISSHELYNSGHLFEASAAHYYATRKRNLLDIAIKNADLLVSSFGPGKIQCPPGHQIVETGLIRLYSITGETQYLELARFFLDVRGNPATHPLYGAYNQDHLPVTQQDEAVGHAVRAVYMYAAMTDIAAIYADKTYLEAVNRIWENMVNKKLYITGGIGARHDGEAFGDNFELPNLTAYAETCGAIGSVSWNYRLFLLSGESKYYDIIERTLYNGLIAGISADGTSFFYPNPLESDSVFDFNKGACTRSPWFECSCCPTNLIRFIPSVPGLVYAAENENVYINLFMSCTAHVSVNETNTEIIQQTDYLCNGLIRISINPEKAVRFTIKLRVPGWTTNKATPGDLYRYIDKVDGNISLKINGTIVLPSIDRGYALITREWSKGDAIELTLPMNIRRVISNERVTENRNRVAVEYGPFVYCAEEIDNDGRLMDVFIPDDAELKIGKRNILGRETQCITGKVCTGDASMDKTAIEKNDYNLMLIPYYLWSNRGVGKMKVWFSRKE